MGINIWDFCVLQTALLLKSQVQAETQEEEEPDTDTYVMDIIGEPQDK